MIRIDRERLGRLLAAEQARFDAEHPRSRALFERARGSLLGGVPMSWMVRWAGGFPLFVESAAGAHFTDVDGRRYLDLCLGDTGAMTGHAPEPSVLAIAERAARGVTFMLPTADAIHVGEEMRRRFGLPFWQFTLTATDANRHVLRLARQLTGRPRILVFNGCYHGTVDESFVVLEDGRARSRPSNAGPPVDPTLTTTVIEWNDVPALERALGRGDVACVLAEPAMTNIGIIHPEPGYHAALREVTRRTGTLLVLDETHTLCCGIGGYTRAHGLQPDILTMGKPLAGGVPAGAYGLSAEVAAEVEARSRLEDSDTNGIGGTLAGNALSLAAMRATLAHVLTEAAFARTIPLAQRWTQGVADAIRRYDLPWNVTQLGCRAEYWFRPQPARNGSEAWAAMDGDLDRYMHLAALNRGILLTPFHMMALVAPQTTEADIDHHTRVFDECVAALVA
jgi:glutamate-1-semialdehyde 2,1-aminomutase